MWAIPSRRFARGSREHRSLTLSRETLAGLTLAFAVAGLSLDLSTQATVCPVGTVALNLPRGGYEHVANLRQRVLSVRAPRRNPFRDGRGVSRSVRPRSRRGTGACGDRRLRERRDRRAARPRRHERRRYLRTRPQRLAVAVRGDAVMAVSIVFAPGTFHTFSATVVGTFDSGALAPYAVGFDALRRILAAGFGLGGDSRRTGVRQRRPLLAHRRRRNCPPRRVLRGRPGGRRGRTLLPAVHVVGERHAPARPGDRRRPAPGEGPDLLDGGSTGRTALRAWLLLVVGALATGLVVAVVRWAAPHPLGRAGLLPRLVAFRSVTVSIVTEIRYVP